MLVPYACRVVFRLASASTRSHAAISLETDTPTPIGIKHRSAITRIITFQSHCPSIVRFVLTAAACEGRITTYPRLCKANALHYVSSSPGTNSRQGSRSRRRVEGLGLLDEGLPHAQLLGDLRSWPSETLGHWPEVTVSGKCPRPPDLNFHFSDIAVFRPRGWLRPGNHYFSATATTPPDDGGGVLRRKPAIDGSPIRVRRLRLTGLPPGAHRRLGGYEQLM